MEAPSPIEELVQELLQASETWDSADDYRRIELDNRQCELSLQLLEFVRQQQPSQQGSQCQLGTSPTPKHRRGLDRDDDNLLHPDAAHPHHYNVRSLLGSTVSARTVSQLIRIVVRGMSDRVDTHELMPLTYDDESNQSALQQSAISLTRLSMASAELYSQLLSVPGAHGAGLVELEALQVLAALLQRWETEVRGNESEAVATTETRPPRDGGKVRDVVQQPTLLVPRPASRQVRQPVKRSRQGTSRLRTEELEEDSSSDSTMGDDDDNDESSLGLVVEESGSSLTKSQLLMRGLQVVAQVVLIPSMPDFFSWSDEAKEVALSTVIGGTANASALQANGTGKQWVGPLLELVTTIVSRSTTSLTRCVPTATSATLDSVIMTQRLQATKTILRGLQPLLLFQRDVPLGAKGKQAAADVAGNVLQRFIEEVSSDMIQNPKSWPKSQLHNSTSRENEDGASPTTPSATPGKLLHTPKTNNKTPARSPFSKRRLSITDGKPTTPLRLKSATKSLGSLLSPDAIQNSSAGQGRPVLRECIATLQRLVLDPVLETSAAVRAHCAKTLHNCVRRFPTAERQLLVQSLIKLTRSKWWYSRQVSCEVAVQLLLESWMWECRLRFRSGRRDTSSHRSSPFARNAEYGEVEFADSLLECLVERLDDKERTLRITCANGITVLLQTLRSETVSQQFQSKLADALSVQSSNIARVLRENCLNEDKALAKKASIGALVELLVTSQAIPDLELYLCQEDIMTLCCFCQDKSQETSKAAAEALTTLLEAHQRIDDASTGADMLQLLERSWAESVLPLAPDPESRMAARLLTLFDRVVYYPIVEEEESWRARVQTAWRIAGYASAQSKGIDYLSAFLKRKFQETSSSGQAVRPLIKSIMSAIRFFFLESNDMLSNSVCVCQAQLEGIWCLLKATIASVSSLLDVTQAMKKHPCGIGVVVECWDTIIHAVSVSEHQVSCSMYRSLGLCLDVIGALAPQLGEERTATVAASIEHQLRSFTLPKSSIGAAINTLLLLEAVSVKKKDSDETQKQCAVKVRSLLKACEEAIAAGLKGEIKDDPESSLVRALFATGELCLVGFSEDEDGEPAPAAETATDPILGIRERPSTRLEELVHAFLPSTVPNAISVPTPRVVRSLAFLTLGKMCLRNEAITVKSVNLFARELHEGGSGIPDVQSNVLVVFGDLCVRYANHVDRFLPLMARCLQTGVSSDLEVLGPLARQGFALVRLQAVHLLSNLIMQDYIKWRGLLFHRFLAAMADEDDRVAFAAQTTLCGQLLTKRPQLFVQNFVKSLFVLNRCTTHPIYKAASVSGDGGSGVAVDFEGIHLDGLIGSARRHQIYKIMLSTMSDEHKVSVTAQLAKEVLGNALETGNDLHRVCNFSNPEGLDIENHPTFSRAFNVLRDALTILRSKLARVSRRREDGHNNESQQSKVNAIKGELLSNINRTQLVEIIIPILVNLKGTLQKHRSPLLKDLMGYLLVVYESYPDKVRDFLSSEPQILLEIEHDARESRRSKQTQRASLQQISTSAA